MEINIPTRAKAAYIETERIDKSGRKVKARHHVIASNGMYSGKEIEQEASRAAKEMGVSEDNIRIETYKRGEAPLEVNPRHRGFGPRYIRDKEVHDPRSQLAEKEAPRTGQGRSLWSGISLPKTEEERQALIAEFEANKPSAQKRNHGNHS